nr:xylulose kinase-1 [Tanacetum cinerariifolium]
MEQENIQADFHYIDDARDIWNAVKARFGGNAKSKKIRKSMLKQEFSEFRIGKVEGLHKVSQDAGDAGEFALMGVTSKTKLDNHLAHTKKWRNSSKNLFKLIDSSMSVRTKVGLGFTNCISENELGWDDSAFSVFTTKSEDMEGRPIFHSGTHLIKDCNFYEKQMANKTVGIEVGPANRPQSVSTGKLKVTPVPTGKPQVSTPVPTGRPNRSFPVPSDRGYSPS